MCLKWRRAQSASARWTGSQSGLRRRDTSSRVSSQQCSQRLRNRQHTVFGKLRIRTTTRNISQTGRHWVFESSVHGSRLLGAIASCGRANGWPHSIQPNYALEKFLHQTGHGINTNLHIRLNEYFNNHKKSSNTYLFFINKRLKNIECE